MKRILGVVSRSSREVPAFATRHKVWTGIVILLAFLAVVIYVPRLPLVGPRSGREAESDFRGHLLQALAGLVLAAGAYFTGRTFALNREGQITERFTRAVEQLADEKLDIRLGGIYALERIARDSETHYEPVMEVLTAFLREHARWRPEAATPGSASVPIAAPAGGPEQAAEASDPPPQLRVDFQAVATVLGRRDRRHEQPGYRLNLREVDLRGVSLVEAELEGLEGPADLAGADLRGAHLEGAMLFGLHLEGANLADAHLEGAALTFAKLTMAALVRTHLERADLGNADLDGAVLYRAQLEGARLEYANLKTTVLSEAIGLTQEQIARAITDDTTALPEYLNREAGG